MKLELTDTVLQALTLKKKRVNQQTSVQLRGLVAMVTCCPKLSAAGIPGASVPGILRRIFLQNCRMSLQDVSRSFSSTARSAFS